MDLIMPVKRIFSSILLASLFLLLCFGAADAREEYAKKTGKGCILCHEENMGGGLKTAGIAYIKNGYNYPVPLSILEKAEKVQTSFHKTLRFIIGYLHILAAFILVGAIFYIHIFVKPSQITGGLPKGERILGLSCLITITITGIYLTWFRIDRFGHFFDNPFGRILFIKILLFALMLLFAITAVTFVHRQMKNESKEAKIEIDSGKVTFENIKNFDGSAGSPAYIVNDKKVYDVSESVKWKNGRHFGKHSAGTDLTEALKGAPHGLEVLEKVKFISEIKDALKEPEKMSGTRKLFVFMAYSNMVIILLIIFCLGVWRWGFNIIPDTPTGESLAAKNCIDCHKKLNPGIHSDWEKSIHAGVGIDCYKCHKAAGSLSDFGNKAHLKHSSLLITSFVSPKTCAECHPKQVAEYSKSKHANTIEIMWKVDKWLQFGMNNEVERNSGCYACHGTVVDLKEGKPVEGSWPNVGVGRKNPDGSFGSCTSCHTRHRFSVAEARKPEACGQCHLGPDHPQIEIYNESKHGAIYNAEAGEWNWTTADGTWKAGRDFRTPTCSACHMSAALGVSKTHDVTERLSWELQAPSTIRPSDFKAFPAKTDWKNERAKMIMVCRQCHSEEWANSHFKNLDNVISNYESIYYKPAEKIMDNLYSKGILSKNSYFDEELEWEFYELWHHEGRRARMGSAMMAPDYAWWHGFYELKHRFINLKEASEEALKTGKVHVYKDFPGKAGKD
jgi:predicted heme/steroid binding protein